MLLLMRADPRAALQMAATGPTGAAAQVEAIEELGGTVHSQWALLGRFDLAVVVEFPTDEVAAAYILLAEAAGFPTETHLALTPHQLEVAATIVQKVSGRLSETDGEGESEPVAPV